MYVYIYIYIQAHVGLGPYGPMGPGPGPLLEAEEARGPWAPLLQGPRPGPIGRGPWVQARPPRQDLPGMISQARSPHDLCRYLISVPACFVGTQDSYNLLPVSLSLSLYIYINK